MPKKEYPYTGILGQPPKLSLLGASRRNPKDAELAARAMEEVDREYNERWIALHKDCGVALGSPGAERRIAVELAKRHVPGFQGPYRKGAPFRGWKSLAQDFMVWSEVSARREKTRESVSQAATYLSQRKPWLGTKRAIESRYGRVVQNLNDPHYRSRFSQILEYRFAFELEDLSFEKRLNFFDHLLKSLSRPSELR
jgi:hypothetical protein